MDIAKEEIIVMAVAAIAEEEKTDATNLRVVSFREILPSGLERYIADHHIKYKKYQLGDEQ